MSRRIDIELTSTTDDGFTWRAAGAKQPKGTVLATALPAGAKVGDELKVEVEQTLDGLDVIGVIQGRERVEKTESIALLPSERAFQPVVETRAPGGRGRGEGGRRRDGGRGRDGGNDGRRDGGRGRDGESRGRDGGRDGSGRGRAGGRDGGRDGGRGRDGRRDGQSRGPRFTPPPELPQRPKPKRLRPGKQHRTEVLAQLPEEQRTIAELALQGMPAVRQRLKEDNEKAVAAGQPTMPEASVLKMAEDLLPRLRVAEWRDRAEAAQRQLDGLDLRDLRSVVATASDPVIARDESTRELVEQLKQSLATRQEQELQLWFGDIDAALAVGRVVRALRLSAQPPKAGMPFPTDIATRLIDSTNASLAPMDGPDRWIAMLEAAAFSPVHEKIAPTRKPDVVSDELIATVTRLAPALPQVAALFDVEVDPKAPMPKPLKPDFGKQRRERAAGGDASDDRRSPRRGADTRSEGGKRSASKSGDERSPSKSRDERSQSDDAASDSSASAEASAETATPIVVDAPSIVVDAPSPTVGTVVEATADAVPGDQDGGEDMVSEQIETTDSAADSTDATDSSAEAPSGSAADSTDATDSSAEAPSGSAADSTDSTDSSAEAPSGSAADPTDTDDNPPAEPVSGDAVGEALDTPQVADDD